MTTPAAVTETVYLLIGANLGPFNTVWDFADDAEVRAAIDHGDGTGWHALNQGPDFTVASVSPLATGGMVTLSNALLAGAGAWPANARLGIFRSTTLGQPSSFGEALGFSPAASEAALDTVARQVEDVAAKAARAISVGYGEGGFQVDPVATRKSQVAVWNADGTLGQAPYSTFEVPGPQGPPGTGSAIEVGLAVTIPAQTIPAGTDIILSSGYNIVGIGAAFYVSLPRAPKNGWVSGTFPSNSGTRWWGLFDPRGFNPYQFGAFGDGAFHPISGADVAAHPEWYGTYAAGMGWDYVATQECIYACYANNGSSAPGAPLFNGVEGLSSANRRMWVSRGVYPIDQTLLVEAAGLEIEFETRLQTIWQWMGAGSGPCLNCDAIAYARLPNLSIKDNTGVAVSLVELNYTATYLGLATQQLTLDSWVLTGSSLLTQYGVRIALAGGNAQGDTINFINPIISGFLNGGIFIGGDNALSIILTGGNIQGCNKDGVANLAGSFFAYGTSCQNQLGSRFFASPQQSQIVRGGADFHTYGSVGTEINHVMDIRSESDVLFLNQGAQKNNMARNCAVASAGHQGYSTNGGAGYHAMLGTLVSAGSKGWSWVLVDDGSPTGWFTPDPASTPTLIIYPPANLTPAAYDGKLIWRRFGSNGFLEDRGITSNTASQIVPGSAMSAITTGLFRVAGLGGALAPNWDAAAAGHEIRVLGPGYGYNTTIGSNVVRTNNANLHVVGNWVMIPEADLLVHNGLSWPLPLYGKISAIDNVAHTITLTDAFGNPKNAAAAVVDKIGYWGAGVADGDLTWLPVDFDVVSGCMLENCAFPNGRGSFIMAAKRVQWTRADWQRTDIAQDLNTSPAGSSMSVEAPSFLLPAPTAGVNGATDISNYFGKVRAKSLSITGDVTLNLLTPPSTAHFRELDLLLITNAAHTVSFGTNMKGANIAFTGAGQYCLVKIRWFGDTVGAGFALGGAAVGPI